MLDFVYVPHSYQVCLLSTSAVHMEKEKESSHHFKERPLKEETEDGSRTTGNEVYRMPHPIW